MMVVTGDGRKKGPKVGNLESFFRELSSNGHPGGTLFVIFLWAYMSWYTTYTRMTK